MISINPKSSSNPAMKANSMSVFAQMIQLLPKKTFLSLLQDRYPEKRSNAAKYSAWDQMIALLFCQLGCADSLRKIELGLQSVFGKLQVIDARPLKRTTLAYANAHRDFHLCKDYYFAVLNLYQQHSHRKLQARFHRPVFWTPRSSPWA